MRRFGKWILIVGLILAMTIPAFAATGNAKVDWLIEQKIVIGDGSGSYKLDNPISRAEATKMLVESLNKRAEADALKGKTPKFKDVKGNEWYVGYLNYAIEQNIINGYEDNTFKPQGNVTYAEMIKMLVVAHGASNGKETTTGFWAQPYIDKAQSIHLLDGVITGDYNGAAPRGKVFEMIYNAMHGGDNLDLAKDQYYALITQNSPTVQVRILAAGEGSAHRIGSYVNLGVLNLNQVLGDVLKVNVDAKGVVSNSMLAQDVKLVEGPAALTARSVMIDGLSYGLPKGYDKEVMLSHDDQDFRYGEFVEKNRDNGGAKDTFVAEYARVYVKGNRVLYVDCYSFDDIAPVRSGMVFGTSEIYVYDDSREGEVRAVPVRELRLVNGKTMEAIGIEQVNPDDVVHIYDRDKALVLRNKLAQGDFKGIRSQSGTQYASIGGVEYQVRVATNKRAVSRDASGQVSTMHVERQSRYPEFEGRQVRAILDLNGHVQLLESSNRAADANHVALFRAFLGSSDVELVGPGRYRLPGTARFTIGRQRASSSDFGAGDLVVMERVGQDVTSLNRVLSARQMYDEATTVERDRQNRPNITTNTISLSGGGGFAYNSTYQYDGNTKIYVVEGNANRPGNMTEVKMPFILENYGQGMKAFVLTTDQYDTLVDASFSVLERAKTDKAKVIVFFDFGRYNAPIAGNAYRVEKDFTPGDRVMYLRRGDRYSASSYDFANQDVSNKARFIPAGTDIQVSMNSREEITSIDRIISSEVGKETYHVDFYIPMSRENGNGKLIVTDSQNETRVFSIHIENVNNLNGVQQGDVITMEYNGNDLIRVMNVYPSGTEVTGVLR